MRAEDGSSRMKGNFHVRFYEEGIRMSITIFRIPLLFDISFGFMGEPLNVVNAVLYLGSDESKHITGIELNIDGGILAGSAARPEK